MQHDLRFPQYILSPEITEPELTPETATSNVTDIENETPTPSLFIERTGENSVENAIFVLSASNSFWLQNTDWTRGPLPGNLNIIYKVATGNERLFRPK